MPSPQRLLQVDNESLILQPVTVDKIIDLRHRVLRAGLPRDAAIFPGDDLLTSHHFAAMSPALNNTAICCATFHQEPRESQPAWRLRGMATDPAYQGKGVGRALLTFAEETVFTTSPDIRLFWCYARTPAVRFYQSLGWQVVSEEFQIPTAGPHHTMIKNL